jgi:hypothetical protein
MRSGVGVVSKVGDVGTVDEGVDAVRRLPSNPSTSGKLVDMKAGRFAKIVLSVFSHKKAIHE